MKQGDAEAREKQRHSGCILGVEPEGSAEHSRVLAFLIRGVEVPLAEVPNTGRTVWTGAVMLGLIQSEMRIG